MPYKNPIKQLQAMREANRKRREHAKKLKMVRQELLSNAIKMLRQLLIYRGKYPIEIPRDFPESSLNLIRSTNNMGFKNVGIIFDYIQEGQFETAVLKFADEEDNHIAKMETLFAIEKLIFDHDADVTIIDDNKALLWEVFLVCPQPEYVIDITK